MTSYRRIKVLCWGTKEDLYIGKFCLLGGDLFEVLRIWEGEICMDNSHKT